MSRILTLKKEYFTPGGKKISRFIRVGGRIVPIVDDNESSSTDSNIRDAIEDKVRKHYEKYWKGDEQFVESDVSSTMRRVDECLDHFKDSGENLIEPSADYDDEIVWRFSGKDKETGNHAGFEFDSRPDEKNARDNLKGNGYTVSQGLIFPKPLFNYLMNYTNVEEWDIEAVSFIAKQALADYKKRK